MKHPPEWKPRRRPDVISQPAGPETILYDPVEDTIHVLNHTALKVWEFCDGSLTTRDIVAYFQAHYDNNSGHDISEDVSAILNAWMRQHLVT